MKVLLWAAVVYLLGISGLLYFRPRQMFLEDGSWREFGYGEAEKTLFPFWLFCIAWAFVSYFLAFGICGSPATASKPILPIQTTATAPYATSETEFIPSEPNRAETGDVEVYKPKRGMKPGYYMMNNSLMSSDGVPMFVYIGPKAPEVSGVSSDA